MKIVVETGLWARRYVEESKVEIHLPEGSTVMDIIKELNIPADEAGIAVIRGEAVSQDFILKSNDTVTLHPIIIGG